MVRSQARAALLVASRTRRTIFFTLLFPLLLLVLFNSIFKGANKNVVLPDGLHLGIEAYFTAGIVAYAVALSTFTTLAVSLTTQRENGQLKRLRGTPMPAWSFIVAQIVRATIQAVLMTAVLLAVGAIAYGVDIPGANMVGFVVYLLLGVAVLCSLGIAITAITPTADAASTIAPFTVVILSFFSGVWIPVDTLPAGIEAIGKVFPLYHLAAGLQTSLAPGASSLGLDGANVAVLAVWGAAGIFIAARRFRWEPQLARG